ncbi:MAG: hypothetical protein Q8Q05_00030 [bacterium]|nr:hypothetical protein [bacterium]
MGEVREVVQEVGERVKVLASFAGFKLTIHFFSWRGRTYKVDSMNLFHIEKDAQHQIYNFAVSATEGGNSERSRSSTPLRATLSPSKGRTAAVGNTYQLTFDPITLEWQLKDILAL